MSLLRNMFVNNKTSDRGEFKLLVTTIMDNWFGLQAAISHGMGGTPAQTSTKLSDITETITNMCFASETGKENLSDTLEDLIDELFNTEFEDGSIDEITEILWNHRQNWLSGNKESIRSYIASMQKKSCVKTLQRLDVCHDKMDTDDKELISENTSELSGSSQQPADPDGWIIPRHNRRSKH